MHTPQPFIPGISIMPAAMAKQPDFMPLPPLSANHPAATAASVQPEPHQQHAAADDSADHHANAARILVTAENEQPTGTRHCSVMTVLQNWQEQVQNQQQQWTLTTGPLKQL